MTREELLGKIKPYGPVLTVAVVLSCAAISLSGYEMPAYASEIVEESELEQEQQKDGQKTSSATGSFDLADGVYQGTGTGFAGDITVSVQIKDKKIVSIEILSSSDDAAFFNRAKAVIDKIIETQSCEVDVVSGATYSSNGIISAVKNALTGEKDSGVTGNAQAGSSSGGSTEIGTVADAATYKDGTYYGTGTGFAGTIKVQVDISGGKIANIQITEHSDGNSYMNAASTLLQTMIVNQSTNVDTVSGATYSSVGLIQAVRNALSQAAISESTEVDSGTQNNVGNESQENSTVIGTVPYVDGIYYGTEEGYLGDITVAVVIQDKTIKAILVTESQDDEAFFDRAMTVVKNVVKQQNTEVDIVSGATYSSNGLLGAIKNALLEAEKATNGTLDKTPETSEPGIDNPEEEHPEESNPEIGEPGESEPENPQSIYVDGSYDGSAICHPDEDEEFEAYQLTLKLTVRNDKIVAITDVVGNGSADNDSYIKRAANGTSSRPGMITQLIQKGDTQEIDLVSRATCTSKAIIDASNQALESAKRQ